MDEKTKIAYAVACYIENLEARSQVRGYNFQINALDNIDEHLDALLKLKHSISLVSFIINDDRDEVEVLEQVSQQIKKAKKVEKERGIEIRFETRENTDGSYGAWDYFLRNQAEDAIDYTVLIEDDYVPVADDFDKKFISCFTNENQFYVCQLYQADHCAISNGVIKNKAYEFVNSKTNSRGAFQLLGIGPKDLVDQETISRINASMIPAPAELQNRIDMYGGVAERNKDYVLYYLLMEKNQSNFLTHFSHAEYHIIDTSNKYKTPFLDVDVNSIVEYGNPDGEVLLRPLGKK